MQYVISELIKNFKMESLYISNYLDVAHNRHSHGLEDEAIACQAVGLDEEGDLLLPRRASKFSNTLNNFLTICSTCHLFLKAL